MPYAERGRVCVACVAIRAAVNGLNGQCVDYSWCGGGTGLDSEIFKEFGVGTKSFVFLGRLPVQRARERFQASFDCDVQATAVY